MRTVSAAVYLPTDSDPVGVTIADLQTLIERSRENGLGKARVLLHGDPSAALHEMLIVHQAGHYIQPHRNERSAKSYLAVDGSMRVIWFTPDGNRAGEKELGPPGSGKDFIIRFDAPVFHTLFPTSPHVAFVETILGPHRSTTYAPWAPTPGDAGAQAYFDWLRSG